MMAAASIAGGGFADELVKEVSWQGNSIRLYAEPLSYEVLKDGVVVVPPTQIDVKLDGAWMLENAAVKDIKGGMHGAASEVAPIYKKGAIDTRRNETLADFGDAAVRLAARPDGVAYRIETKKPGVVTWERADLTVPIAARLLPLLVQRKPGPPL